MTEIEKLALLIALQSTERQDKYAVSAKVPWYLIRELRKAFGPRYVAARKRMNELQAQGANQ